MNKSLSDQTIALAGVVQAATLVDNLARKGLIDGQELTTAVNSILNDSPNSVIDVFGGVPNRRVGLSGLRSVLEQNSTGVSRDVLRYAMSLLHLEAKLRKKPELMDKLDKLLARSKDQAVYFESNTHDAVIGSMGTAYSESISLLDFRIQVMGNPTLLQDERIASRIRTLLLFGIRSAVLWRQKGGRRWHFLLYRRRIQQMAKEIQTQGLH